MGFISEYASQDDINKYKLDELLNKYQATTVLYKHHWTVNKDTGHWLIPVKQLNTHETIWILHYKKINIEIQLWMAGSRWDLTSITTNSLNNIEIIEILQKALENFEDKKIVWSVVKKTKTLEVKNIEIIQTKEAEKPTKNKEIYIGVFLLFVVSMTVFFIMQKSTNHIPSIDVNTNKVNNKEYDEADNIVTIDKNMDGSILISRLKKSSTYFDLTGNGMKTKTEWIQPSDAILVYDKNNNGKIDNINELIRNKNITDNDLHLKLKIWQDKNKDGISQSNELVKFDMKYLPNLMIKKLRYDPRISYKDLSTIQDYKEMPISKTLPFLRGYGVVADSNILYNVDDDFRVLAIDYASDMQKTANKFEGFMDAWSGYTKMQKNLQKKYNLSDTPKLLDLDRKVWTYERFMGKGLFSEAIESRLEQTASSMQTGGHDIASVGRYNTEAVNNVYTNFINRNKAYFSLKAFYSDVMSDAQYGRGIDEYVIKDRNLFHLKIAEYMNHNKNTLNNKLYLAKQMNVLKGTFLDFDANKITSKINDHKIKKLVKDIFAKEIIRL